MSDQYENLKRPNDQELRIPSDEEVAAIDPAMRAEMAAVLLRGIEPGRQPLGLFAELCRLTVASTVEVVPIRIGDEGPEVWLHQRDDNDPWWPSKWALPGVVIMPIDAHDDKNSLDKPIARLFESELSGVRQVDSLHQLPSQFRHDGRGNEVTTQYWTLVETADEPYHGQFFNVGKLREAEPEGGLLEEGWMTINRAMADYESQLDR